MISSNAGLRLAAANTSNSSALARSGRTMVARAASIASAVRKAARSIMASIFPVDGGAASAREWRFGSGIAERVMKAKDLAPLVRLRLRLAPGVDLGPGKADLLEGILE